MVVAAQERLSPKLSFTEPAAENPQPSDPTSDHSAKSASIVPSLKADHPNSSPLKEFQKPRLRPPEGETPTFMICNTQLPPRQDYLNVVLSMHA